MSAFGYIAGFLVVEAAAYMIRGTCLLSILLELLMQHLI